MHDVDWVKRTEVGEDFIGSVIEDIYGEKNNLILKHCYLKVKKINYNVL